MTTLLEEYKFPRICYFCFSLDASQSSGSNFVSKLVLPVAVSGSINCSQSEKRRSSELFTMSSVIVEPSHSNFIIAHQLMARPCCLHVKEALQGQNAPTQRGDASRVALRKRDVIKSGPTASNPTHVSCESNHHCNRAVK